MSPLLAGARDLPPFQEPPFLNELHVRAASLPAGEAGLRPPSDVSQERDTLSALGEVSERSKERDWKSRMG